MRQPINFNLFSFLNWIQRTADRSRAIPGKARFIVALYSHLQFQYYITKTRLYNFDPLKPQIYSHLQFQYYITKTRLYNFDPLKPQIYSHLQFQYYITKTRLYNFDPLKPQIYSHLQFQYYITKTRLYNFDPLKPHFYIVKLGFTGVYIMFLISAQKHRLWVLVRTASPRRF